MPIDPKRIEEWRGLEIEAIGSLLAERAELLAILRGIEWSETGDFASCPVCGGLSPEFAKTPKADLVGHETDCKLAAFLKEPACTHP